MSMKQTITCAFLLAFAISANAQTKETTTVKTTTTTTTTTTAPPKSGFDLLGGETWNVTDATTFTQGAVDLRLAARYTESAITDDGDTDNAWTLQPVVVWGASDRLELAFTVPIKNIENLGDAPDGNYDSYLGGQYRFTEQEGCWPALALASNIRIPTGNGSNGMDWELRLVLTNEYDSGIRSHVNLFGLYADHDNYEHADLRNFQYGTVLGLDGPLGDDGSLRWVLDWQYRISDVEGGGGQNTGEAGLQWQINECNKIGFSVQMALDHAETTSDVGAR
jgi:hypothetical protein